MKRNGFIWIGVALLLVFQPCMADDKVRATGKAVIYKNFTQIARDRALDNAKRLAVEQSVQVFIKSETLVQNYELIYDRIFARYVGYIDSFEIIEDQPRGSEYTVTIEAVVKTAILKEELENLLQSFLMEKANPRLMVVFQEPTPNALIAESALIGFFIEKGFKLTDSKTIRTQMKGGWPGTPEQEKEKMSQLGQQYGAEIIILGSVQTSSNAFTVSGVEMFANRAAVTVKVVQSDTGELMATGTREEKLPGIKDMTREPLEKASRALAQELTEKMVQWWQNELNQTVSVILIINGLGSYKEAAALLEQLPQEARGVQNIHQRFFDQDRLELEINLKGKIQFLAHDLIHFKLNNKACAVVNQTANILTVRFE